MTPTELHYHNLAAQLADEAGIDQTMEPGLRARFVELAEEMLRDEFRRGREAAAD